MINNESLKILNDVDGFMSDESVNISSEAEFTTLYSVSDGLLNALKGRVKEVMESDKRYLGIIGEERKNGTIVRSSKTNLGYVQDMGSEMGSYSSNKVDNIHNFFKSLNIRMDNIREEKRKKYPKPERVTLENPELAELKYLKEEALRQIMLDKERSMEKKEETTLTLTPKGNSYGFINKGSLFISLGVAVTIIEVVLLVISKL